MSLILVNACNDNSPNAFETQSNRQVTLSVDGMEVNTSDTAEPSEEAAPIKENPEEVFNDLDEAIGDTDSNVKSPEGEEIPVVMPPEVEGKGKKGKSEDAKKEQDEAAELAACGKLAHVKAEQVLEVGDSDASIKPGSVVALRLTGNMPSLKLNLVSKEKVSVGAVCLFLAGNQAKVDVVLSNVELGKLIYVGRGNQPIVSATVDETSAIKTIEADLAGNQAKLVVGGAGSFPCEKARLRGNKTEFVCNK